MPSLKKMAQNKLQKKHFPKSAETSHVGMHYQRKTLPQKPTKQATMRDAFTAYLPSLHLSNHTHHKPYHTPIYNTLQHTPPSTIITILNRDTTTTTLTSTSTMITYFTKHNAPRYSQPKSPQQHYYHQNPLCSINPTHKHKPNRVISTTRYTPNEYQRNKPSHQHEQYTTFNSTTPNLYQTLAPTSTSPIKNIHTHHNTQLCISKHSQTPIQTPPSTTHLSNIYTINTFTYHAPTHSLISSVYTQILRLFPSHIDIIGGVWLERCRDGRYVVNASHCDVWVVGARLLVCIVACFVGFWGSVFRW